MNKPLKEENLKGTAHTIDDTKAWLLPFGYSDTINDTAIIFFLCEIVKSKVSFDYKMNMDRIVELLRLQLEFTKEHIERSH